MTRTTLEERAGTMSNNRASASPWGGLRGKSHARGHADEPKNIDDLVNGFQRSPKEEENISAYEAIIKSGTQAAIHNKLVKPAFEGDGTGKVKGAYYTATEVIDKIYQHGKVDGDEANLHKVFVGYLMGYYSHAKPGVLKSLPEHLQKPVDQLSKADLKSLYETLAHHFDQNELDPDLVRTGRAQGLSGLVKVLSEQFGDEEISAEEFKRLLESFVAQHKGAVIERLKGHAQAAYIDQIPHAYAKHVIGLAKKAGKVISPVKEATLYRLPVDRLSADIHEPLVNQKSDDIKYKQHGFYNKDDAPKPKDKHAEPAHA